MEEARWGKIENWKRKRGSEKSRKRREGKKKARREDYERTGKTCFERGNEGLKDVGKTSKTGWKGGREVTNAGWKAVVERAKRKRDKEANYISLENFSSKTRRS